MVKDNTSRQIFERFAAPGWRQFEEMYHAGKLSVEQFNAAAFDLVEGDGDEIRSFALEVARPREGLLALLDWAHWQGWPTMMVSNGFDLYTDAILDSLDVRRMARHAGRAKFEYRWRVTYLSPRGIALESGFKLSYASALRDAGDTVVYVGDGASDVDAAMLARTVFARSTLLERAAAMHPDVRPFETLDDIVASLNAEPGLM